MGLGTNWKERLSGQANAKPLISCENEFHLRIKKNLFLLKALALVLIQRLRQLTVAWPIG